MYALAQIADILDCRPQPTRYGDQMIQYLSIDSRTVSFPARTLFFALRGMRMDGHRFISDAYQKGVRAFVIAQETDHRSFPGAAFLVVPDTLRALQILGQTHRSLFDLPCFAITGSNGKTWVKEWLFHMLRDHFKIVRSPRSYNSQIGVPLSLWQIHAEHDLGIFEAGISRPDEMQRIESLIAPTAGIFTNLGDAHAIHFESPESKLDEKLNLFRHVSKIFFCMDQESVASAIMSRFPEKQLRTWSAVQEATLRVDAFEILANESARCTCLYAGSSFDLQFPFSDNISLRNALLCTLVCLDLGVSVEQIRNTIRTLPSLALRQEMHDAGNGCLLINDGYSFDIESLKAALAVQEQHSKDRKKTMIISDLLQQDEHSSTRVRDLLEDAGIMRIFAIGEHIREAIAGLGPHVEKHDYETTDQFLHHLDQFTFSNEVILLKGARAFRFERIAYHLRTKTHTARLEVDLSAILHNLQFFTTRLRENTRMMVMVKASAYGSGSIELARFLEFHHADYLAVAYTDEGIELRNAGIQTPILVLNPDPEAVRMLFSHQLEPEIYSIAMLEKVLAESRSQDLPIKVHIKLDTGMHRLGFQENAIAHLCALFTQSAHCRVQSVFTHLAASENPAQDTFTHQQCARFLAMYDQICQEIGYRPARHILNSAGILRFPEYQFEMVRLGLGLYGVGMGDFNRALMPAHKLVARISQVRTIEKGETVSYGRLWAAPAKTRIATLNIGYADGLLRAAGLHGFVVQVHGKPAPIIGSICMDMCMINVTHINGVRPGDEVVVFGVEPTVEDLAHVCRTIPYEILSRISQRVTRLFLYA